MIAFTRWASAEGLEFPVEERIGENPVANQNPAALPNVVEECAAAEASGFPSADPADVALKRQDGKVLSDLPDESASAPRSLHLPLDGLHHTELEARMEAGSALGDFRVDNALELREGLGP
jgi:hypothetical protein